MYPVLFNLGVWRCRSYDVVLLTAAVAGVIVVLRETRKMGLPGWKVSICLIGTVISALVGGRINGWLFWFGGNLDFLDLNLVSHGNGMTAFGAFAGAFCFTALFSLLNRWSVWRLLDTVAPVLALTEGIQRAGCFLNGCCHGRDTGGFLGVFLPDALGNWAYRYPVQIITGLFCVALFFWLWQKRTERPAEGMVLLYYLVFYHTGRVAIDFMRGDEPVLIGMLTFHQVTAAIIACVSGAVLYFRFKPANN
jgi:phosphatidylglycerol---prolipoprotein diacylglyceryl transferase